MSTPVLRTLLLTDLVGSTALLDQVGDRRGAELGARFDRISRDLLAEHRGIEIDKTDGFLLIFEQPDDAVRYALAMHQALLGLSAEENAPISARCGIHLGQVHLRQNDPEDVARGAKPLEVEGLAKPLAARVMSLALGGQTLLTRTAFDVAKRASVGEAEMEGLEWLQHGIYDLKGVSEGIEICEVGARGTAPLVAPPSAEKALRRVTRKRRRVVPGLAGFLAAAAIALTVFWYVDPMGEKVSYYRTFQMRNGALEGLWETDGPPPVGEQGLKITTVAGNTTDILVLGPGVLTSPFEADIRRVRQTWVDGQVTRADYLAGRGQVRYFADVEHTDDGFHYRLGWPDGMVTTWVPAESSHLLVETDDDGLMAHITELVIGGDERTGAADTVFVRDDLGRVLRRESRDADGNPALGGWARVTLETTWDPVQTWRVATERTLGFGDALITDRGSGCAEYRMVYDDQGRLAKRSCFDRLGKPAHGDQEYGGEDGCFSMQTTYGDDHWKQTCLDAEDQPIPRQNGVTTEVNWIDERGQVARISHLDAKGEPVGDNRGVASTTVHYDDAGMQTLKAPFLDVAGTPVWTRDDGWGWRATFDEQGNRTAVTWLDDSGEPGPGPNGHVVERFTFNPDNRPTSMRFYDAENQPTESTLPHDRLPRTLFWLRQQIDKPTPFHGQLVTYSPDVGGPVAERYVDRFDQPVAVDGVASRELAVDPLGTLVMRKHLDANGEPVLGREQGYEAGSTIWCYGKIWERDTEGIAQKKICLGPNGKPMATRRGYASLLYEFDTSGRRATAIRLEGANGEPVVGAGGYAVLRRVFKAGSIVRRETFDAEGNLASNIADGCAVKTIERDDYGNETRTCCFDAREQPTFSKGRVYAHCFQAESSPEGKLLSLGHFGVKGEPIVGNMKWHRVESPSVTTERGTVEQVRFYGIDGAPTVNMVGMHGIDRLENPRGQVIEESILGPDGGLMDHFSCARNTVQYDDRGNVIRSAGFDAAGEPCALENGRGPAEYRFTFDSRGSRVRKDCYDGRGNLVLYNGYASMVNGNNTRGHITSSLFFGIDGDPIEVGNCAEYRFEKDEKGRDLRFGCYDADGNLALEKEGYAERVFEYANSAEELTHQENLGLHGELVLAKGFAILERSYDPQGHKTREVYRGVDDDVIQGSRWTYDAFGMESRQERIGDDDELVDDGRSARRETKYGPFGNPVEVAWFDAKGDPAKGPEGCVKRLRTFDASGAALSDDCET